MNEQTRMNAADAYFSETSQKELAAGVLEQAKHDLRRFRSPKTDIEREIYRDAYRWLTSDDGSWPLSFLNVCRLLNLSPESERQDVLGDLSVGPVHHLIRLCGRTARKLQLVLSDAFSK